MNSNQNKVRYWRESNDYRSEYFKKNPGLLGCIWFCSQCGVPLKGKENVQVDHIIPPSLFAKKKYKGTRLVSNTSLLSIALNSSFNTVAICHNCNLKKSNKVGMCTVKGTAAKGIEVTGGLIRHLASWIVYGSARFIWSISKALALPFRKNNPLSVKIIFTLIYLFVILYLFY